MGSQYPPPLAGVILGNVYLPRAVDASHSSFHRVEGRLVRCLQHLNTKRSAQQEVRVVSDAVVRWKRRVIDIDPKPFFDNVRHHILLNKVAQRVDDDDVMIPWCLGGDGDLGPERSETLIRGAAGE